MLRKEKSHFNLGKTAETNVQLRGNVSELLIQFAGADEIITYAEVENFIRKANTQAANIPEDEVHYVIESLCDAQFLGLETAPGEYQFIYDENKKRIIQSQAQKTIERVGGRRRYRINVPFHSFLDIRPAKTEDWSQE
jgi:hypothetical protein